MGHSVVRHLRVEVEAYDASIRQFIPDYETMLAETARCVAESSAEHILDLGAGTGALSEAVLAQCPQCRVELIDTDGGMLDQARERLRPYRPRVRFTRRRFQGALPQCDAVVASLALHHVPTLSEKRTVYGAIHAALEAEGVFVNADANMPADAIQQRAAYTTWAAHLVASGIPEPRAWGHFREWADEDTYLPLDDELGALTAAGFSPARVWQSVPINVVKSTKTPDPRT
ncbi:MAG: class I SAM-dependent methyltransferase [Acidobacteria bacterium]|nr:class I SAM-dependent methyltransferase [Acidobacteriota bacterium]